MRNLLFALFIAACLLSAQEKPYLLEYTVEEMVGNCGCPVEGSVMVCSIVCRYGPASVKKFERFESAEAAMQWVITAPTGWVEDLWLQNQYAKQPDKKPKFVALYRLETVPVEVATETTTKERVVVDQEHETVYRLEGREFRKAKPETAFDGASFVCFDPDCSGTITGSASIQGVPVWVLEDDRSVQ